MNAPSTPEEIGHTGYRWFVKTWAVFGIALFAATWNLWTPQTEFPQIPFFEFLVPTPGWIDWTALSCVGFSLLVCLLAKSPDPFGSRPTWEYPRIGCWLFASALATLILLNQHRLQPWAYQYLIFAILIGLSKPKQALALMRWVVISIYVFSALSKFDYQFVNTIGNQMLATLTGFAGLNSGAWDTGWKSFLILLFPTVELLTGIGLAIPKTRRLAVIAAVSMHASLLLLLGPWGMSHQPGVLIWNLFFAIQAIFLFGLITHTELISPTSGNQRPSNANLLATWVAVFVVCFPMTQWIGICDHWPAWQVYSPSSSRAQLVNERRLASWSIVELGVPIYPQARFQLAVAIAIAQKHELDRAQIEWGDVSHRISGKRHFETLSGQDQFQMKARTFWLNTKARKLWFD